MAEKTIKSLVWASIGISRLVNKALLILPGLPVGTSVRSVPLPD